MNIRNFDLNLLLVFRTVFEEKNVTKASKKLGITQPAMSNALNRLRYLVKDELFIRGGPVLYILFGLTFLIFTLLVDKYLFIFVQSKTWVNSKFTSFVNSNPPSSTKYKFVEATLISNVKRKTASNIKVLDGLIGMTPMIGLLGTVYGMIEVFEVLSFMGTGNPRAMSSGVAKATIPTMAGMVISLFGLYFRQDLNQRMDKIIINLRDSLKSEGYQL